MAAGLIGIIVEGGETFYAAACAPRLEYDSNLNTESAGRKRSREAEKQSQMEGQGDAIKRKKDGKRRNA